MVGAAYAGFSKPEKAIRYRQAVMTVIGQHIGQLAGVIKGEIPYAKKEVVKDATVIKTMAGLPWEAAMAPGSDKGDTTLKSSALKEKDKFMKVAQQFEMASQELADTAQNGDLEALKSQFGKVVQTCKACHSTFRKK
ncbi:MAG: cytochrome c [Desulfobacteraceae bacterium]